MQEVLTKTQKKEKREEKRNSIYKNRVWEIDLLRGIVIFGMLIDHFIGDFWMITGPLGIYDANDFFKTMYSFSISYWSNDIRICFRLIGVMLLLIISGISAVFSKKTWKRALITILFGGIVSGVFAIIALISKDPDSNVIISPITCIGVCLLIYALMKMLFVNVFKLEKQFKWISLAIAVSILVSWLFVVLFDSYHSKDNIFYSFNSYSGSVNSVYSNQLNISNVFKIIFGFKYFGSDWMPLLPYIGYMFLGGFIGEILYKDKKSLLSRINTNKENTLNEKFNKATSFINFAGRKSMWFYVIHQPVFILLIVLIALCMGVCISF